MFYIHQNTCISPQQTFNEVNLNELKLSNDNLLHAIEPNYKGVPPGQLRRMGKAVRMGVGSALPLLIENKADGILIATANGGIEDSILFLNQIIDYEEGRLTPTAFVQSTYNAIAGVLGMITKNTGYNSTHVHRGLAFENVVLDAAMLLVENPKNTYLIGGVDEISVRNHRMVFLAGWYKHELVSNADLFTTDSTGTLPGEGAAMFLVNNQTEGATAKLSAVKMVSSDSAAFVKQQLELFLKENLAPGQSIDLFLTGENGDNRLLNYYTACEELVPQAIVARYKHLFGEFQTVAAHALWLACHIIKEQTIPPLIIKNKGKSTAINKVLIYNNYQGAQHGFMLVELVA